MRTYLLVLLAGTLIGNIIVISIMVSEKQPSDVIYEMGPLPKEAKDLEVIENDCCTYEVYRYNKDGKEYVRIVNIVEKSSRKE